MDEQSAISHQLSAISRQPGRRGRARLQRTCGLAEGPSARARGVPNDEELSPRGTVGSDGTIEEMRRFDPDEHRGGLDVARSELFRRMTSTSRHRYDGPAGRLSRKS